MTTPREVFLKLVNGVCDGDPDLARLYAEETHVSHPFDPAGSPPLTSREELRAHFAGRPGVVYPKLERRVADLVVHETTDPEVIVAEFAYEGRNLDSGGEFRMPCVFVMRIRDGEIVESRDYLDHVRGYKDRGMVEELIAVLRAG
ncbi:MAG TPA: nuclear transport factor 2 family protein [Phytomonospora sp.]